MAFVDRMVHVARHGDPAMKMPPAEDAERIATVEAVEKQWAELRPVFESSIQANALRNEDIAFIVEHDLDLVKAVLAMEEQFIRLFSQTSLASILVYTAQQSEHLSFLVEELFSDMLLIAYGHDVAGSRQRLAKNQETFQTTLTGVIRDNPEKRQIPAPNKQIRAQLGKVQMPWEDVRPMLQAATAGTVPSTENLRAVLPKIEALYEEMETAVAFYDKL